jgi:hypothetical protein
MIRKLCVAGCSFSDYTQVEKCYGKFLSEKLDFDYLHEGAGCGSNYRIWRRVAGHIIANRITPNDIVIIQYTNPERREFFSKNTPYPHNFKVGELKIAEEYEDGSLIRYKYGSHVWQDYSNDKEFFKIYENDHINIEYDRELFNIYNMMFQSLCKEYNITTVFIKGIYSRINELDFNITEKFKPYIFHEGDFMDIQTNQLSPGDKGHMSLIGHENYSELLYEHLKKVNLI